MFRSKALKDLECEKRSKIYDWWIQTAVSGWYYDFEYKFIKNPIFQVKRLYQWYKNVFQYDFDFDGHCLFAIIEYKLKRIERVLFNGHAVQEVKDLKALKLAIKLAGRLKEDKYEDRGHDRIEKKWGELKTWFEPCNDGTTNSYWRSSRPKANTEEEKEQEIADRRAQYVAADYKMKREERWLYDILHKYLRFWWD
jgi:hypothetical protein